MVEVPEEDLPSPLPPPPVPDLLVPVARYEGEGEAMERALVVLAMQSDCAVDPAPGGGFEVLAEPRRAEKVVEEIVAYDAEVAAPRPVAPVLPEFAPGYVPALLWVVALMVVFLWQGANPGQVEAFVNAPEAVLVHGEWWRPFTALFLHADLEHLMGNIALGGLLGLWVGKSIGAWKGWGLTLLAGTLGNWGNVLLRRAEEFSSLGASTAVFGALGLLTGIGLFHAFRHPSGAGPMRPLVPLVAGVMLLAWLGAGGPRTDVSAHVCGFVAGAVIGPAAAAIMNPDGRAGAGKLG